MPSRKFGSLRALLLDQDATLRRELRKVAEETSNEMMGYLQNVTATWKAEPSFSRRVLVNAREIKVIIDSVGAGGTIFDYVDRGTKGPYPIEPKRPGYPLRFSAKYNARTQPIAQYDVGDGKSSGAIVRTYKVMHPGIKARDFRGEFARVNNREFRRKIENAFRRASRRGG